MLDIFSNGGLFALLQVIFIDIVLAGDNALVIGMSAAHVALKDRHRVIFWGLVVAVVLRVILAVGAVELLRYSWVMLAGGLLLLWVCWRLLRDIKHHGEIAKAAKREEAPPQALPHAKAMRRAILSIAAADVSMSLDNVLAVAAASMRSDGGAHVEILAIGLMLSIALMGLAANVIARLLNRYHWISYAGLVIVLYVAVRMIWHGAERLHQSGAVEQMMLWAHGLGA